MKLLLYCTKAKPYLLHMPKDNEEFKKGIEFSLTDGKEFAQACIDVNNYKLNGKIVAECDFEVEKLQIVYGKGWETKTIKGTENIEKLTCLNRDKLYQYCKGNGYAIHIKNLHIFDKPREFSKCYYLTLEKGFLRQIKKAPQNMCYAFTTRYDKDILISIRPEWLCKILNREKTIEVRKKVLKEMLE